MNILKTRNITKDKYDHISNRENHPYQDGTFNRGMEISPIIYGINKNITKKKIHNELNTEIIREDQKLNEHKTDINKIREESKKVCEQLRRKYNIDISDCGILNFKLIQKKMFELKNMRRRVILLNLI